MGQFKVCSRLNHSGTIYERGALITELTDAQAAPLLADGVIELYVSKGGTAAPNGFPQQPPAAPADEGNQTPPAAPEAPAAPSQPEQPQTPPAPAAPSQPTAEQIAAEAAAVDGRTDQPNAPQIS